MIDASGQKTFICCFYTVQGPGRRPWTVYKHFLFIRSIQELPVFRLTPPSHLPPLGFQNCEARDSELSWLYARRLGSQVHQISLVAANPLQMDCRHTIPSDVGIDNLQIFGHWNKSTLLRQALPDEGMLRMCAKDVWRLEDPTLNGKISNSSDHIVCVGIEVLPVPTVQRGWAESSLGESDSIAPSLEVHLRADYVRNQIRVVCRK